MQGENWFDQDRYDCLNGGLRILSYGKQLDGMQGILHLKNMYNTPSSSNVHPLHHRTIQYCYTY